jgi:ABC-2 type transport system permease protein
VSASPANFSAPGFKAVAAIARREAEAYFAGPIGWICLVLFSLLSGIFFSIMIVGYAIQSAEMGPGSGEANVTEMFVQGIFGNLSVVALLLMPALTMGLIAQDRRERSMELLLTSPISSLAIVVGKFLGGLAFAAVMVASTAYVPAILYWLGDPDSGVVIANYTGFLAMMGVFVAVGLFTSSLTDNQLVALAVAFTVNLTMWIVGWFAQIAPEGAIRATTEHLALLSHFEEMSKGVLHTRDAVYFVSVIVFFVFATTQRVEALRWR